MSGSEDHDQNSVQGSSGIPAKRAIEEQDRKVSMDDGNGSGKKKRISLSCAQCKSYSSTIHIGCGANSNRRKEKTEGLSFGDDQSMRTDDVV
jgi:hypothetical protein